VSDGMRGQIYTSIAKAPNGDIWLTHNKGVDIFNPNNMKPYMNPPQIQITGLKVNNETYKKQGNVTEMTEITLPYSENTVELEFVAIEFADPENNQLKCRLDGIDAPDKWIDRKNTEGVMTYYKLPHGSYTFRIKAANADGIWTTIDKTINITILPPWYLTWWAKILWVLLLVGGVYAIIKVRERNIKRKADFAQKILKTEMQALRSQMNPHFLFNTLNSINAFVLKNDSKKASHFLTNFSHLIRKILDFSQKETISLEKEVEILRGYLDMEALRFDNSFDFDIEINEALDEWETQVPTMILQPFIENAILHGIRHKKDGRGKIIIRFEPDGDDYFKCILEDNGIGRAKAAEINAQTRPKNHVSKGMQITQDRLDILNHQKGRTATLTIDDLKDENNYPTGTRVTIRIPTY
jgi:two-component sensor histidine kinase